MHFKCTCLHMGVLLTLSLKRCAFMSLVLFWFCFSRRALARGEGAKFSLTSIQSAWGRGLFSTPDPRSVNRHLQQYRLGFTSEDCVYVRLWDILCRTSLYNALGNIGVRSFSSTGGHSNDQTMAASRLRRIVPLFCLVTGDRGSCRPLGSLAMILDEPYRCYCSIDNKR